MIKMQVIGHLGKDCQVNTVSGKSVINFTVAHSEKYKDSQGVQVERTIWVDCSYWTDRTAVAPYLTKGTQVFLDGQPDLRTFQRNDGTTGATLTLRVRELQLIGSKKESGQGQSGSYAPNNNTNTANSAVPSAAEVTEPIDDLPF